MRRERFDQTDTTGKEVRYLDALVRGVYAKRDLPEGMSWFTNVWKRMCILQYHYKRDRFHAVS